MQERSGEERRRIELNGTQVAASALAAVSSAFLLSSLGAAGTMIGAAIASVCATVGSAVYVHVFRRTGDQLRDVRAQMTPPPRQVAAPPPAPPPGAEDATRVMPVFDPARGAAAEPLPVRPGTGASGGGRGGERPRNRTWLVRSAVGAVAVFVLAMAAITVAELGMGKSFASVFGNGGDRPTISEIGGGGGGHKSTPDQQPTAPATADPGTGGSTGEHAPVPGATGGTSTGEGKDSGGSGTGTSPTATPTPTATETPTAPATEKPTDKPTAPPTGGSGTGAATPPADGGQDPQVPPAGDAAALP